MSPRRGHIALVATAIGFGAVSVAVVSWQISTVRRRHRAVAAAEMLRRGRVAADNGDHEGADANFRSAIELGADPAEAWNLIGIALRARGRYEEALAAYDRAIVAGGETAVRLTNRANALRALGRTAEAERQYVRASELDRD